MLPLPPGARILIYGIGNPGRQDDALGVLLVAQLEAAGVPAGVTLEANYQLAPEDALLLSEHDIAIVVDATVEADAAAPYSLRPVEPRLDTPFTSHALGFGTVLQLCERLYGRAPRAYALAIPAYAFEINAGLSPRAAAHLARACADVTAMLAHRAPA